MEMTIEIVSFPIKNGDFPLDMVIFHSYVRLPEAKTMMVHHYWTIAFVAIRFTIMLSGTIILMMSIIK